MLDRVVQDHPSNAGSFSALFVAIRTPSGKERARAKLRPASMGIRKNKGRWTHEEHEAFLRGVRLYQRNWEAVAAVVPTRTVLQIRTHSQKYFAKIDRGEAFPDQPYPSQYDAAAGKAGANAGAYVYGQPHEQLQHEQRQLQQLRQLQHQHQHYPQHHLPRPVGIYGAAMRPTAMSMEQALPSSSHHQCHSGGGCCRHLGLVTGREQQRTAEVAAAGTAFPMLPSAGPLSSAAAAAYGGGSGSGGNPGRYPPGSSSFAPAVHGYAPCSGAAPVTFGPPAPLRFCDSGGAPPQPMPMPIPACSGPQQHDAMRIPSAAPSSRASVSLSPPPPSWAPSPGLFAGPAAGFAGSSLAPARWHGGGVPTENGGGGGGGGGGGSGEFQQNGGVRHQQLGGFGVSSVAGAPLPPPPALPPLGMPPMGIDGTHNGVSAAQQQHQQQQQQQQMLLMQNVAPEAFEDFLSFDEWTESTFLGDDHGGGGGGCGSGGGGGSGDVGKVL